jgi:hypothetical protein
MADRTAMCKHKTIKETLMEKETYVIGQRADHKLCAKCNEERGHIVTSVSKRGQISR